jgi:hypothetical protein
MTIGILFVIWLLKSGVRAWSYTKRIIVVTSRSKNKQICLYSREAGSWKIFQFITPPIALLVVVHYTWLSFLRDILTLSTACSPCWICDGQNDWQQDRFPSGSLAFSLFQPIGERWHTAFTIDVHSKDNYLGAWTVFLIIVASLFSVRNIYNIYINFKTTEITSGKNFHNWACATK